MTRNRIMTAQLDCADAIGGNRASPIGGDCVASAAEFIIETTVSSDVLVIDST
jgi:hypothetical protein